MQRTAQQHRQIAKHRSSRTSTGISTLASSLTAGKSSVAGETSSSPSSSSLTAFQHSTRFRSIMIGMLVLHCTRTSGLSVRAFQQVTIRPTTRHGWSVFGGVGRPVNSDLSRLFATSSSDETKNTGETSGVDKKDEKKPNKTSKNPKKPKSKKKFKVVENITQEHLDKLAAAFDEMARKEGFDSSMSQYADNKTFEADFTEEDYGLAGVGTVGELDEESSIAADGTVPASDDSAAASALDSDAFDTDDILSAFDVDEDLDGFGLEDADDDFIDLSFGGGDGVGAADDMESRIAAAQAGNIYDVSPELDEFAENATMEQLQKLGFKREANPFGNDETPRRDQFQLITEAMTCPACGAKFQCTNEKRPGYLPKEKHAIQVKLSKIEEMQKLQEKANNVEWSPEDEIEYLLQTSDGDVESPEFDEMASIDIDAMAEEMGLDLEALTSKKVICKRCHGLQNFGKVDESLRPGWTDEPLLSQEKFRELLRPLREKSAVIIALVDLFDFGGSVLTELDGIAGENPVLLAANKADLLPAKMGHHRAENWVRRELEYMGIQSIANVGGAVQLVSCKTGFGVSRLMQKARDLADEIDGDVYIVGAANAGKSTLINHILEKNNDKKQQRYGKKRAGNESARKGAVTVSPLPGTTLEFIKVDIGFGRSLYDTPGLLVPGTLTQKLTPEELKIVVPKKQVEPITFRVASGKCVLVGGLARIEVIGDSKPFLFTFYIANEVKLHPTASEKADNYISKQIGKDLTPPLEPGLERMEQIGEFEHHDIDIDGAGWKEAAADITLRGLGWVAVTGAGVANVRVSVPKGIGVAVRPPLMPFDVWDATAKYTGTKAYRRPTKSKSGKKRRGVGRK